MTYLVDANILSEAVKPQPHLRVVEWLRHNEREIAVDPVILGEIRFGILLLPPGQRRRRLDHWFVEGVQKLQCIAWNSETGLRWAKLVYDLRVAGNSMPIKDSMIAATSLVHRLTVVTHNTRDFLKAGVKVIDPFSA